MQTTTPEDEIRTEVRALSSIRQRPCLLLVSKEIEVLSVRQAIGKQHGERLDIMFECFGGHVCTAYCVVRELRRRFRQIAVYVPLCAKSASTLLCLGADELILSDFGELGPLDAQLDHKQRADFPRRRSCLERFKVLDELRKSAIATFDDIAKLALERSGMRPLDAFGLAADFTSKLYAPLYSQIDPNSLGEDARLEELAIQYAERVLRRYRPSVYAANGSTIVERLVRDYPAHCFVIDREELQELGLPVRAPDEREEPLVERMASLLMRGETQMVEVVHGDRPVEREAAADAEDGTEQESLNSDRRSQPDPVRPPDVPAESRTLAAPDIHDGGHEICPA